MKNKRGQLTIFIIVAIVLVVALLAFFFFKDDLGFGSKVNVEPIKTYVQTCLENVSEEVVFGVGLGGGYFYPPEFSDSLGITYYWGPEETFNFPLKEEIEEEIGLVVSEKLSECVGNFSGFVDYEINQKEIEGFSVIEGDKVIVDVDFPIQVVKDDESVVIKDFETEIDVRLGDIYSVVERIVYDEPSRRGICLSCIFSESLDNDLVVDMLDSEGLTTVFVFSDVEDSEKEDGFEFVFANDYSEENGI